MRILITNDDGIAAPGVHALIQAFRDEAELCLVCPDRERSGTAHSITVFDPIRVEETRVDGAAAAWVVGGTPVDCVKLAMAALVKGKIDLVISGINHGANLGTDVLYSGTVAGAAEGVILGVPAIAASYNSYRRDLDFSFPAQVIKRMVQILAGLQPPADTLLNINFPDLPAQDMKGLRVCSQGIRNYGNVFEERKDPRGKTYYWMGGGIIEEANLPGSDVSAIQQGFISITPIRIDRTDYKLLKSYSRILEKHRSAWDDLLPSDT